MEKLLTCFSAKKDTCYIFAYIMFDYNVSLTVFVLNYQATFSTPKVKVATRSKVKIVCQE